MTDFSVNVAPKFGKGKEFTRQFKHQINAEIYITAVDNQDQYEVTEYNFIKKFTPEEIETEALRQDRLLKEAHRLERQALNRTRNNLENPNWNPCEICGGKHENYKCCEQCNYNTHRCHFCGDDLGHSEVSVCYILEGLGE